MDSHFRGNDRKRSGNDKEELGMTGGGGNDNISLTFLNKSVLKYFQ